MAKKSKEIEVVDITRTAHDFIPTKNEFYVCNDGIMYGNNMCEKVIIPKDIFVIAYQKWIVEADK